MATMRMLSLAVFLAASGCRSVDQLYQFNVTVPNIPAGDQPVAVEIGGVRSQDGAFIAMGK
jgi:uncharacterized protein (TIGR03437 family)